MKWIQTFRNPFSLRCLTTVLFAVFLLQSVSVAQFIETFEGYDVGTAGDDTSIDYFYGPVTSTVSDGGPNGSKELCVTRDPMIYDLVGFGLFDSVTPIPLQGSGTVLTSYDFRVQSSGIVSGPQDNGVSFASLSYWESLENNLYANLVAIPTTPVELFLVIGGGGSSNEVFVSHPLSDFNFPLGEPGEWSDYYSLQLEVRFDFGPVAPLTGVAVAKLVDTAGNVLLSTTKEISSFPFSQTGGTVKGPDIYIRQDQSAPISKRCYDNFSHSVTFVAAEPIIGDANQDGTVNFLDIAPFISLLQSRTYLDEADVNRDGVVDFLDIAPFIEEIASQ